MPANRWWEFEDAEVSFSGLRVARTWQLARRPDGRIETWLGRRSRPGRGENRSGLAFDRLLHD